MRIEINMAKGEIQVRVMEEMPLKELMDFLKKAFGEKVDDVKITNFISHPIYGNIFLGSNNLWSTTETVTGVYPYAHTTTGDITLTTGGTTTTNGF